MFARQACERGTPGFAAEDGSVEHGDDATGHPSMGIIHSISFTSENSCGFPATRFLAARIYQQATFFTFAWRRVRPRSASWMTTTIRSGNEPTSLFGSKSDFQFRKLTFTFWSGCETQNNWTKSTLSHE